MAIAATDWSDEILKAGVNFAFVAVLGGAAGTVWARARHRRESNLAALAAFYDVYGQWFGTWKQWTAVCEGALAIDQRDLYRQAAETEGRFEALLVKIAMERPLSGREVEHLGRFREGYQRLRESIEQGQDLPFRVMAEDQRGAYVAFKALSVEFANLLAGRRWSERPLQARFLARRPGLVRGQLAFVEVTSWRVSEGDKEHWWNARGSNASELAVEELKRSPCRSDG